MSLENIARKCPKCKSENIYHGNIGGFFQDCFDSPKLKSEIEINATACLDCGYIELYLNPKRLEKLKEPTKK